RPHLMHGGRPVEVLASMKGAGCTSRASARLGGTVPNACPLAKHQFWALITLVPDVQGATVQNFDQLLIYEYAQPILFGLLVAWTGLFRDGEADGRRAFAGALSGGNALDTDAGFGRRTLDGLGGFEQRRGSLCNRKHTQPPAISIARLAPNAPTFVLVKRKFKTPRGITVEPVGMAGFAWTLTAWEARPCGKWPLQPKCLETFSGCQRKSAARSNNLASTGG